jgi:hypothetical protein
MRIELEQCDCCKNKNNALTKVHLVTGKRGRPPIRFYCEACLKSQAGTYHVAGSITSAARKASGAPVKATYTVDGFRPECLFLLSLAPVNLFEPVNARDANEWIQRCKGCGEVIERSEIVAHHSEHKSRLA